jgi:pyruvate ferredoxin oxidoreductase alpha subunit
MVLPDQEQVDEFLPPYEHPFALDPDKPVSMGCYGPPYIYTEVKKRQNEDFDSIMPIIPEVWKEFEEIFGRKYNPIEEYKTDGAETLLLTQGSYSTTARMAVDRLGEDGKKVGHIHLRLWRPFPFEKLRRAVKDVETLVVFDRCISFGMGGPLCSEVKSALYHEENRPRIGSVIGGLGGRDVHVEDFERIIALGEELASKMEREYELYGVRE